MQMQLSDKGRHLLHLREGCRLTVYRDVVGKKTIGYGHLLLPHENFTTITQKQADELFDADLKRFVDNINSKVKICLSQDQFDALVSFSYNIGTGGFNKSTVLRKLNAGDILGAAEAFTMWNKPRQIIGRRYAEYTQFKGLI